MIRCMHCSELPTPEEAPDVHPVPDLSLEMANVWRKTEGDKETMAIHFDQHLGLGSVRRAREESKCDGKWHWNDPLLSLSCSPADSVVQIGPPLLPLYKYKVETVLCKGDIGSPLDADTLILSTLQFFREDLWKKSRHLFIETADEPTGKKLLLQ